MKKSMLALVAVALLMVSFSMLWADTVTISEGDLYYGSFAPVYNGFAYTYSQQIYYQSQLNFIGMINKIRFYYFTGTTVNSNSWTIYMGETSKTAFSSNTDWIPVASMTQVFSGNVTFPGAGGWMEITLDSDFPYTNTGNLVIAVDENTAGSATAQWVVYNSSIANRTIIRATSVDVDPNLPGTATHMPSNMNFIQLDYVTAAPPNPSAFVATPVSLNQIDLGWTKNVNDDDVMIAVSSTGVFGIPIDGSSYLVNDPVVGGGTIIYNGPGTSHQHMGLTQNTQYFYKAWSVDNTTAYSTGVTAVAATLMPPIAVFPWLETFETSSNTILQWRTVPGSGNWALSQNVSAWGIGSRSTTAQFFSIPGATPFDLVSPTLDTSGLNNPMLSFDFSYATYTGGEVDQMDVYYSLNNGASYTLLLAMPGGPTGILNTGGAINISFIPSAGQWASQTLSLPPNVNKIMFRATSAYGNNLYLDNVQVFKTWDIPANVLTDIGGADILSQVNLDLIPGVSVGDPVFASLNNLGSLNSSLVYGLTGSGMTDLDFSVGTGTWYGVLFVGANMFIGFPNPLTGPGTISFYNVDFDAKGDVYVLLGEGADPTLPVELSSFAATLTADMFV
ncbi:MAG: hypothetical protein U1B83_00170, partial [Candidatus Cloacimonadaceae bacterium]|nr:hypothetical protein [Candidatus Cloacimonadaceae bacterium]